MISDYILFSKSLLSQFTHISCQFVGLKSSLQDVLVGERFAQFKSSLSEPKVALHLFLRTIFFFKLMVSFREEKMWMLDVIGSNVTAMSSASFTPFTLGKQNWTIKGDTGCSSADTYDTELKMSECQKDEFACNDGQCVRMDQRCNQLPDCRDESDEENCKILLVKDGYNKKIPPDFLDDPVNVSVSIELLRLVDINEERHSIDIQFDISLLWKDKRVTFFNLKRSDSLNVLTEEDINKLWLPKVIYENTDQKEITRLGDTWEWETEVIVRREVKHGVMSGLQYVEERENFKGSENSLVMNQTYTHTFQCNYQLSLYPFDTQVNFHS